MINNDKYWILDKSRTWSESKTPSEIESANDFIPVAVILFQWIRKNCKFTKGLVVNDSQKYFKPRFVRWQPIE